jgi:hypothetical protein
MPDFLPSREPELVTWIGVFKGLITAAPTTYGLVAGQATTYGTLATNYVNAYNLAKADATRTPSNIIAKDDARKLVVANTRLLAGIIQKFPGTTDQMRSDLGLTVPASRTPIPPPVFAPTIDIVSVSANTVKIRIHEDGGSSRRGLPAGVKGISIFSAVGAAAPTVEADWTTEGITTRTVVDITFPATVTPGSKVWFTAFFFNPRLQNGPAATPVSTNIAGGSAMAA